MTSRFIELYKKKDVDKLCKVLFPNIRSAQNLTKNQIRIIRKIAFVESRRIYISAMTRYGKSQCIAIAVCLYIIFNKSKKIALIGPTLAQTEILRNYISELIVACPVLSELIDIERDNDIARLLREASRKRFTFKHGFELRILSAEGEAYRVMGFGADVTIIDEAPLIKRKAYAKIVRMLGDDPENSILIEIGNPWDTDTKAYDHFVSGRFDTIEIGYEIALEEGRTTETFIREMREELTPIEFRVLYESKFPDENVDSLFKMSWINNAISKDFEPKGKVIISCDPADKGIDWTVIMWGYENEGSYKVGGIYSEPQSDNMGIANRIAHMAVEKKADIVKIDCIGIGVGVISRLRELLEPQGTSIVPCNFGESPKEIGKSAERLPTASKKRFRNKKAEQYFRLRNLFEEGLMDIPKEQKLTSELMKMAFKRSGAEKIQIVDPEDKSPDFADALVYFVWEGEIKADWFAADL